MPQHQTILSVLNVPDLDGKVARGAREDVLGGRVEEDVTDFSARQLALTSNAWSLLPGVSGESSYGCDVGGFVCFRLKSEAFGHSPEKDLQALELR
jgi:hypothetical protein